MSQAQRMFSSRREPERAQALQIEQEPDVRGLEQLTVPEGEDRVELQPRTSTWRVIRDGEAVRPIGGARRQRSRRKQAGSVIGDPEPLPAQWERSRGTDARRPEEVPGIRRDSRRGEELVHSGPGPLSRSPPLPRDPPVRLVAARVAQVQVSTEERERAQAPVVLGGGTQPGRPPAEPEGAPTLSDARAGGARAQHEVLPQIEGDQRGWRPSLRR